MRQDETCNPSETDAYRTHVYPFDTLPTLNSHVHPSFALLHLSSLLVDRMRDPYIFELTQTNTLVAKVAQLAVGWRCPQLPHRAKYDPTFLSNPAPRKMGSEESTSGPDGSQLDDNESDEDLNDQSSDGDSFVTPPRLIRYPPLRFYAYPSRTSPSTTRPFEEFTEGDPVDEHDMKRRKMRATSVGEVEDDIVRADGEEENGTGWTEGAISSWARECSTLSESPYSLTLPCSTTERA